ncbi:hypothetical protein [Helicobacter ganmani]
MKDINSRINRDRGVICLTEKDYPTIYNHLLQHKDKLQARG